MKMLSCISFLFFFFVFLFNPMQFCMNERKRLFFVNEAKCHYVYLSYIENISLYIGSRVLKELRSNFPSLLKKGKKKRNLTTRLVNQTTLFFSRMNFLKMLLNFINKKKENKKKEKRVKVRIAMKL